MSQVFPEKLREILAKLRPIWNKVGICMGTCSTCGGPCTRKPGHARECRCRLHNWVVPYRN